MPDQGSNAKPRAGVRAEARTSGMTPAEDRLSAAGSTAAETLPRLGFVLLAALSLLWGSSWPIMKIALREIPPWTFRTLCLACGGLGVLTLGKTNGLSLAIPIRERKSLLLVALLNITGWHLCSAYGVIHMPAGRAVIVAYTMPLFAALMGSFVLGERLTPTRLVGLGFGTTGLAILIGPDIKALGSAPLGAVFMLGAAVSWAAGTVAIKYFRWTMPTVLLTGWQLILGGVPVVIGALILEPITALSQVSWQGALATAYIMVLPMIFCHWAWFKVVDLFPATVAAIGTLAIPIIGVFSSGLVLGEPIGFQEFAALVLMVMALATVMIGFEGVHRWLRRVG